jgi:hypothetical protein
MDGRSKIARLIRTTKADLVEQLGGAVSPAQALIIQSAALKAARLYLLSEKLIAGDDPSDGSDHHALAWLNSMRLDLMALGLERRAKDISPRLEDIIADHSKAAQRPEAPYAMIVETDPVSHKEDPTPLDAAAAE